MNDLIDPAAVTDLTMALVAADTRNPPGNERAAADVARQALQSLGATFTEVEPEPGRTSVIAQLPGADPARPTLIVCGHLDVVPFDPDAWSHDPLGERDERAGLIYGRGTADMKGGIAAAIEAVRVLDRAGVERAGNVTFVLVADEERGSALGMRALIERRLVTGDACIVPEPTDLAVSVAELGVLHARVTAHGVPAHASVPAAGVSAIETAARFVLALHGADYGGPDHPLLGRPTANVGVIEGGRAHNVVADRCVLRVDRRLLPGRTAHDGLRDVRQKLDPLDDPDRPYDLEVVSCSEPSELGADHPFVATVCEAIGAGARVVGATLASDARFVRNQLGIPAVVCGPGAIAQAHVHDEHVTVDSLVEAAGVYARLMATFGSS